EGREPAPVILLARRRLRSARPIDPPIKPTPTMATERKGFIAHQTAPSKPQIVSDPVRFIRLRPAGAGVAAVLRLFSAAVRRVKLEGQRRGLLGSRNGSMIGQARIGTKSLATLCRRLALSLGAGVDVRTVWAREAGSARGLSRGRMAEISDGVSQ